MEEYFRYHPPTTEERKTSHNVINGQALAFAKAIDLYVTDPECKKMAIFALQQCRMFANQGITIDELRKQLHTKTDE